MPTEDNIYQDEIKVDEEYEAIMPDGYAEGDDYFNPEAWTGDTDTEGASGESDTESGDEETMETEATDDAPAIEHDDSADPDSGEENDGAPATDPDTVPAPSNKRKVKFQFDHQDHEEEIDLDTDLPELLQKARSVERYKERLNGAQSVRDRVEKTAKALKYDSAEAFLDAILDNAKNSELEALTGRGVPDEIAEDYVSRKYADADSVQFAKPEGSPAADAGAQPATSGSRDFSAEAKELLAAHPELLGKELPQEIYSEVATSGKSLLQAYNEYEMKAARAETNKVREEADKVRKENRILKQNADSADRAPVSGVSKGGRTEDKDNDPFLKGFNSIW